MAYQVGPILYEPFHAVEKLGVGFERLFIEHFNRIKRNDSHPRAQTELVELPARIAQDIIEESILFVPQPVVVPAAHFLHSTTNVDEMFKKLGGEQLINPILSGQLQGNAHQVQTEKSHPSGPVGLLQDRAPIKLLAAIDHRDVVQTKESTFENVV